MILRDRQKTLEFFQKVKPTHVIHLAALVGGLFKNLRLNLDFFVITFFLILNILSLFKNFKLQRVNSLINDNVLSVARETGVVKVISWLVHN